LSRVGKIGKLQRFRAKYASQFRQASLREFLHAVIPWPQMSWS
jgi:hypothetical protein